MKINELKQCMENLKANVGSGLIDSAMISLADGQPILAINPDPKRQAIVATITGKIEEVARKAEFGPTKYFIMNFEGGALGVCITYNGYCWATLVNKETIPLGMLLNVILPDCIEGFKNAL